MVITAVQVIVVAACQNVAVTPTTIDAVTTSIAGAGGTTTTGTGTQGKIGTYRLGIFADITTDNVWALYDTGAASVWNSYVLGSTKPSLYTVVYPGIELANDLAADLDPPAGSAEGSGWAIEVGLRHDAVWSDGTAITAQDVVFTFETVRDLALGGGWPKSYPLYDPEDPGIVGIANVEAIDDSTVKFTFNHRPGLAIWPHAVGLAPVMPAHVWTEIVEQAKATENPLATLEGTQALGLDVSGGPMIFTEWQRGQFARSASNDNYYNKGRVIDSGGVRSTTGPFAAETDFIVFDGQQAALAALQGDEVDLLLNPLGMQRGLMAQVQNDPKLTAVVNLTNGFRYVGFNLRKEPMSIQGFRDALALMIDKEFLANEVFQGSVFPLYATVPRANLKWYNPAVADSIASQYVGKTLRQRLQGAVQILKDSGFTWVVEPSLAAGSGENAPNSVRNGEGAMFNGVPVGRIEILAPGEEYDPIRATYSLWIARWLSQLGFDAEANPTDFGTLREAVQAPNEAGVMDFDMFILGWTLGSPSFPSYHRSFFHSANDVLTGGANAPGYNSPEFDALADQFDAAQSEQDAYDLLWQMEETIARDKPYIVLFDPGILEFYRNESVAYPFTTTLDGLQNLSGLQGIVFAAK